MNTLDRSDSDNPEETPDPYDSMRNWFEERRRKLYNLVEDHFEALADAKSLRGGKHSAQISKLINEGLELCEDRSLRLDDLAAQLGSESFDSAEIRSQLDEVSIQTVVLGTLLRIITDSIAKEESPPRSKPPKKGSRKKKPSGDE